MPISLSEIIEYKREEVALAKAATPLWEFEALVSQADPPRNFFKAVTQRPDPGTTSIIAEIKRKSPSAGLIREEYEGDGFRPEVIAKGYFENGASAISCLTDKKFFDGELSHIERIRQAVPLPVLRKDFIIDPWQVWQSRAFGADAILLIAECLKEAELVDMLILARRLQMTVLLEVHELENLLRVRPHVRFPHPGYCLLGINNRNLQTMTTDLNQTLGLVDMVEDRRTLVSESGIRTPEDLARLRAVDIRCVLVGESLLREENPGQALAALLNNDR